ncbi:hypothetical protein VTN31DRAFT_7314 [Thermomyces dupontii]|uniref:uncharacterized protein n=1 Tax=Talaromyces thermophilus TaxID=28565 RepID=UPI00374457CA
MTSTPTSYLPLTPHHAAVNTSSSRSSSASASAAERWKAVVARDANNNSFVYGVKSTRIYCRPCCPGRLARRANVEFFDTPAEAEMAGYRSCKRCQPQLLVRDNPQARVVQQARRTIAMAMVASGQIPRLQDLAAEANLTPSHFHRVFKKITGVTPVQYAKAVKADLAKAALSTTKSPPQSAVALSASVSASVSASTDSSASASPITPVTDLAEDQDQIHPDYAASSNSNCSPPVVPLAAPDSISFDNHSLADSQTFPPTLNATTTTNGADSCFTLDDFIDWDQFDALMEQERSDAPSATIGVDVDVIGGLIPQPPTMSE